MPKLVRYGTILFFLVALVGVAAAPMGAQTVQGVITGTVFDNTGAVIPNATVTYKNVETNATQTVRSGGDGSYRFNLVPPGVYSVTVTAAGFAQRVANNVRVDPSVTVPLNFTMVPATATTRVEVTSQAPLVQTANSDLTETIDSDVISNTALLTRNINDLAFLAPQVSQGMNFGIAAGGQREQSTAFLLNGADNNDNFSEGMSNVTPPLEAVGEFTMLTNQYGAQYGRAMGAVVSTSEKSGGNSLHGVLYEFNRNKSFNAADFFDNRNSFGNPKYVRNQFGAALGGPIIKDKTFYYVTGDLVTLKTQGSGSSYGQVIAPDPSELASMEANAGPLASYFLKNYTPFTSSTPCPALFTNGALDQATVGHLGCVAVFDPLDQPQHNLFGRIDQSFGSNDRVSLSGTANYLEFFDAYGGGHVAANRQIPSTDNEHYSNISLVYTHIFSPTLLNEFTVAQNRHFSDFRQTGSGTDPEVAIDGQAFDYFGFGFGPFHGSMLEDFTQDRWLFQDNASWTAGKHAIKYGFSFQPADLFRNWDLGGPGYFEFANTTAAASMVSGGCSNGVPCTPASQGSQLPNGDIANVYYGDSNFQYDFPYLEEFAVDPRTAQRANAYRHYYMDDAGAFIQDDWKVTPRLTLNLGLRWEHYDAPKENNNIIAQFTNFNCIGGVPIGSPQYISCVSNARTGPAHAMWHSRNKDFGPRFGFAWDTFGDGRTSLRGGFGIYYDRIFDNIWSNGAWNPPFYGLLDADTTGGDTISYNVPAPLPVFVPDGSGQVVGHRVSIRTMENYLKDTSGQNWYLGLEHQFMQSVLLRVNYQGTMGRHEPVLMNWNRYDGMCYNHKLSCGVPGRPNPLYTGFNNRSNQLTSNYNALIVEAQKRMSNGLQFQGSYTWSKLLDRGSALFTGSTTQGAYSQPYYFISNVHQDYEYGRGAFDHTQGIKFNATYQLPFLKSQQGVAGHILGGWQLNGFYQAYSGHPIEVYNGRRKFRGDGLDPNGNFENIGGDYNLDRLNNDHPNFVGTSFDSAYAQNQNPADGIFTDNNPIGCGFSGAASSSTSISNCNAAFGVTTPNTLFVNPPGYGVRYGNLGRNAFHGPWFNVLDASLFKNVTVGEGKNLQLRVESLNALNHPNFDGIVSNLNSGDFGKARCVVGDSLCPSSASPARRLQLGVRFVF